MGGGVDLSPPRAGGASTAVEFYSIPVSFYRPDELIDRDLYLFYQGQHLLFRPRNMLWTKEDSARLKDFGVSELFIHCDSEDEHHQFLEDNIRRVFESEDLDQKAKAKIMYATSETMMKQVFDRPNSPATVQRSVSMVKNSIDFLKNQQNFFDLMSMASTKFSEYTHAIQVSAFSITLAKEVGLKSFNELSAVGIGALLHDIGKVKIDSHLLNKKEELNEDEKREVQNHPQYGYEILRKQRSVPETAENIVLQHHERPNQTGYPYRMGHDMSLAAKIVSIADCFDSLTSDRTYKDSVSAAEAIRIMRHDCRDDYDRNLLVDFIRVLGIK